MLPLEFVVDDRLRLARAGVPLDFIPSFFPKVCDAEPFVIGQKTTSVVLIGNSVLKAI